MATLLSVLQATNVAALVLSCCAPQALAVLECCSRALRALIAGLPTATWQARACSRRSCWQLQSQLTQSRG